jgi:hypothetical protein
MIRYNPETFKGLHRNRFVEAVNAEGIPLFGGYPHPLYKNPMFRHMEFPRGKGRSDYGSFEKRCPVAERACAHEALWLEQRLFLGTKRDMEDIASSFRKVQEYADEIL